MEFYYPGQHLEDPLEIGKNYQHEDISMMLADLEEFSYVRDQESDRNRIVTEGLQTPIGQTDELIYNVIVAECLRGQVFNEVGDYINICLKKDGYHKPSKISNIATDQPLCFTKAKARVVATSRKFPGFFKFSGYKQMNLMCPDIVMTKKQLKLLLDKTYQHFPDYQESLQRKV